MPSKCFVSFGATPSVTSAVFVTKLSQFAFVIFVVCSTSLVPEALEASGAQH